MKITYEEAKRSEREMQKKLGISDETLKSMKQFFMRTSVPRLIERERKKNNEL